MAAPQPEFAWLSLLVKSVEEVDEYRTETRGPWPAELRGTLYRNGPGLFERNGVGKRSLGDGDGMIRAYRIGDGQVSFRSRFIRTTKFREEEAAGRYLYPTWSTRAPGGWLRNIGRRRRSQAEENVIFHRGKLLAFDEVGLPWALDPETLETVSRYQVGAPGDWPTFLTHSKKDPFNGEWTVVGSDYHRPERMRIVVENRNGEVVSDRRVRAPRPSYVHDFFATPLYLVFNINALRMKPLKALLGLEHVAGALHWQPEMGNVAFVVPKDGSAPFGLPAPAVWSVHTVNAYEVGEEIVCDFIGLDNPDYLFDKDGAFSAIMRDIVRTDAPAGRVHRWRIDTAAKTVAPEILDDHSYELPTVDPLRLGLPYRHAYLAAMRPGQWWPSGIARLDVQTGRREFYEGRRTQVFGEPLFVPRQGGGTDEGWVLAEALDGRERTTTLHLFDAGRVSAGPIAEATLRQPMPTSFHGCWVDQP